MVYYSLLHLFQGMQSYNVLVPKIQLSQRNVYVPRSLDSLQTSPILLHIQWTTPTVKHTLWVRAPNMYIAEYMRGGRIILAGCSIWLCRFSINSYYMCKSRVPILHLGTLSVYSHLLQTFKLIYAWQGGRGDVTRATGRPIWHTAMYLHCCPCDVEVTSSHHHFMVNLAFMMKFLPKYQCATSVSYGQRWRQNAACQMDLPVFQSKFPPTACWMVGKRDLAVEDTHLHQGCVWLAILEMEHWEAPSLTCVNLFKCMQRIYAQFPMHGEQGQLSCFWGLWQNSRAVRLLGRYPPLPPHSSRCCCHHKKE